MRTFLCILLAIVSLGSIIFSIWSLVIDEYAISLTFALLWLASLGCLVGINYENNKHRKIY